MGLIQELHTEYEHVLDYLETIKKDAVAMLFDSAASWEKEGNLLKPESEIYHRSNVSEYQNKLYKWENEVNAPDIDLEYQFQILNTGDLLLPTAIEKLIVFAGVTEGNCFKEKISNNLAAESGSMFDGVVFNELLSAKDKTGSEIISSQDGLIRFKKIKSLPDFDTVKAHHSTVQRFCKKLGDLCEEESRKVEIETFLMERFGELLEGGKLKDYEIYSVLREQSLGDDDLKAVKHNNNYSYIGGYIWQLASLSDGIPDGYEFLMQFGTAWGNQDMLYIYYDSNNVEEPFYINIVH